MLVPLPARDPLGALAAALDGTGPAVLPLPPEGADRVLAAVRPDEPLEVDGVAAVVRTSGSTGEPRGALLTRSALLASARATRVRLGGPARWLRALPVHHVAGLQVLVRSLDAGTVPVDLPPGPFTAAAFAAATELLGTGRRCTALVPTQLVRLLDDPAGRAALATYDAVLLGGAAAPAALVDRARGTGARVVTTYGMTETCGGCVYDGVPLDGVLVAVDGGRVRLGGPTLFAGYRLRPDLTRAVLRGGWFDTADLGRLGPDGRLVLLGRADDVVVTGGENVAAAAVAAALDEHPGVRESAVAGVPDDAWGQRVVAVVVPADPAAPPALEELRAHVARRLGRASAPRGLVVVGDLPRLALGKVDRAAVRRLAAGG